MTSSLENTSFGRHVSKKYAKTEGLDFSKILMKKDHLDARTGDETCVSLKPHDFFKILRLLGEKNDDDIESACYSLITCLLENDEDELDPAFVNLLNNQQSYNITFPEDGESYNTLGSALNKNEIAISSVSMNEIAKFLGKKDAIGISDFISIAILMFSPEELENRKNFLQRLTLMKKKNLMVLENLILMMILNLLEVYNKKLVILILCLKMLMLFYKMKNKLHLQLIVILRIIYLIEVIVFFLLL